jgi:hypothetical protein
MTDKNLIPDDESPLRRLHQQSLEDLEDEGGLMPAEEDAIALALTKRELRRLVFHDVRMP